jgi:hypothetical protein
VKFQHLFCRLAAAALVSWASIAAAQTALPATIGPYLQNPGPDRMTVCFLTREADYAAGYYHAAESALKQRIQPRPTVIAGTPWTLWKAALTGLKADSSYVYQLTYGCGQGTQQTALLRFNTLSSRLETPFKAAFFNDLHSRTDTLEALMAHISPEAYDVSVLMGDCWQDPSAANGAEAVFRVLDACVRMFDAGQKPMLYLRGNHETRGDFAASMAYLFDLPLLNPTAELGEQAHQFALTAGPVRLIALDTGEDFNKRAAIFEPMRQRQAEWLRHILSDQQPAPWQILVSHQPLFNDNIWYSEASRALWEPILANAQIDIALAAHDHKWKRLLAGQRFEVTLSESDAEKHLGTAATYTLNVPWPILIGGGPAREEATVMLLTATASRLDVRIQDANGRTLTELTLEK